MATYELTAFLFMYIIISFIQIRIAFRLHAAKNSYFRRLMVWFFVVDAWVYIASAMFFLGSNLEWFSFGIEILIPVALIPKTIIAIATLLYVNKN